MAAIVGDARRNNGDQAPPGSSDPRHEAITVQSLVRALPDRTLLLVDGDALARRRLERAMATLGFEPTSAAGVGDAIDAMKRAKPAFAIIDTQLDDGSGLEVVEALHAARPEACIVILTSFGSIASAVAATRAGAADYLAKPAGIDDIAGALLAAARGEAPAPSSTPMSAARVRWEHIQRVYELCNHNVSQTARRLSMHRRTLQRVLGKRAPV